MNGTHRDEHHHHSHVEGRGGENDNHRLILGRLALDGLPVAAVDADLNHTLTDWVRAHSKHPIAIEHELDETRIVPIVKFSTKRMMSS